MSKYGIGFDDALWHTPISVIYQLIIYDDLANGRKPRWATAAADEATIDDLIAGALTPGL